MDHTQQYIEDLPKYSIRGQIPLEHVVTAYNAAQDDPVKQQFLADRLIGNHLKMIAERAQEISDATHVDLDELIQEGNLAATEYFRRKKTLSPRYYATLYHNIERAMYALAGVEIRRTMRKAPLRKDIGARHKDETKFNIDEARAALESEMPERDLAVIDYYRGAPDAPPLTFEQIGQHIGITRSRAQQIYLAALHSAYSILYDVFGIQSREKPRTAQLPIYSKWTMELLEKELERKQGVTLDQLTRALHLTPHQLAEFIKDVRGIPCTTFKLKKDVQSRLDRLKNAPVPQPPKDADPDELRKKVTDFLGVTPAEFIAYFGMSQESFAYYIREHMSGISLPAIRNIISAGEGNATTPTPQSPEDRRSAELELLERVLHLLRNDATREHFSSAYSRIPERIKHALFPIYITNPAKCLNFLDTKIEEYSGTPARRYFVQARDFFRQAADLTIPGLRTALDDFQKVDVLTLSDRRRHILASETGVGKSLEVIATALHVNAQKILIITNKTSAYSTWAKEIDKHTGQASVVITGDEREKDDLFAQAQNSRWTITTYETFAAQQSRFPEADMIVVDEADAMNNHRTQRTKAIMQRNAPYKYCVSGWAFRNKRSELWPLLNWLYPDEFPFRDAFLKRYCSKEWGRLQLKYEISHAMICRTKKMVLPNLPGLHFHTIETAMTEEQQREYSAAEADFVRWYEDNHGGNLEEGIAMAKLHTLRRAAIQPKFEGLRALLDERHATPGKKSVVFCTYVDEATKVADDLSRTHRTTRFDGRTTSFQRQNIINAFNTDPEQQILVMTEAGGKSVELTGADHIYLLNPLWTFSMKKQLVDRLHRRGQRRQVHAFELVTQGTLEEKMQLLVDRKREEYEKTVLDTLGYSAWFDENQDTVIHAIIDTLVKAG